MISLFSVSGEFKIENILNSILQTTVQIKFLQSFVVLCLLASKYTLGLFYISGA